MIVGIQNNLEKGPGYAIINLRTRSGEALPEILPGTETSFSIESPSRDEFLGPYQQDQGVQGNLGGQWVQSEVRLKSFEARTVNGEIILPVGPEVVDNLEPLENYRFCIYLPSGERCGALVCRNIIPSPLQAGRTGFGSANRPKPEPTPQPIQEPIQEPVQELVAPPMPEAQQPWQPLQVQQSPTGGPDYLPFTEHLKQQPYDAPPIGQGKGPGKAIAIIILIFVLLSALLFATCYYFGNTGTDENAGSAGLNATPDNATPDNATDSTLSAPLLENLNATTPNDSQPEGSPEGSPNGPTDGAQHNAPLPDGTGKPGAELSPLQMARGVLRNNPSMEELQKALTLIPLSEENADAYFLLREQMAEMGDVESMYLLGIFYDPTSQTPHGSIEKDPEQSYTWYLRAKTGGWQSAESALSNLKTWLQQQAANGSDQAQTLLNNWE